MAKATNTAWRVEDLTPVQHEAYLLLKAMRTRGAQFNADFMDGPICELVVMHDIQLIASKLEQMRRR